MEVEHRFLEILHGILGLEPGAPNVFDSVTEAEIHVPRNRETLYAARMARVVAWMLDRISLSSGKILDRLIGRFK